MKVMDASKAIKWLETQFPGIFISGSVSMLRKIAMKWARRQWLLSLEHSLQAKLSFIFMPGCAGVQRNVQVDRLAGKATMEGGRAMDQVYILNALREISRLREPSDDSESLCMVRLRELQVKRGVANKNTKLETKED